MNFLKNLKDKIKVIFRGKEKEQETEVKEEEQITELIQAEVPEEEADKEQEVIQENTELADNIKEVMKKFPLKSKVVLLGDAIEKLDNIELLTLVYYVDTYSLIISENKEYVWVNLKNTEYQFIVSNHSKLGKYKFKIILTQGLNRQIRRMCEALGYEVKELRRVRIMNIELGNLKPGEYRKVTDQELNELYELIRDSKSEPTPWNNN